MVPNEYVTLRRDTRKQTPAPYDLYDSCSASREKCRESQPISAPSAQSPDIIADRPPRSVWTKSKQQGHWFKFKREGWTVTKIYSSEYVHVCD